MMSSFLRVVLLGLAGCLLLGTANAQQPFYKGKRLTLMINFAPGGPSDIEGLLVAKHLVKHIAGNPQDIVQNKDGAGGLVGTNYIGEVEPRDGSMVGVFNGSYLKYVLD